MFLHMKKLFWIILSFFALWLTFGYTPTAHDQAMLNIFTQAIEKIRTEDPQRFESLKALLPALVQHTKDRPSSHYIFSGLYAYFIGGAEKNTWLHRISVPVVRVIDGDTLIVIYNGEEERVRLIGVDAPETVHPTQWVELYGQEASNFAKNTLENKTIELEFDVQKRDQYGRLLAYVWIDGEMFNKTILQQGYAYVSTRPPNVKYVEEFTKLQQQAHENQKWLWQFGDYAAMLSVDINTATLEQLKNIVHIDDARAQQIINLRPFARVEDLTRVNGIWPARLAEILEQWVATVK